MSTLKDFFQIYLKEKLFQKRYSSALFIAILTLLIHFLPGFLGIPHNVVLMNNNDYDANSVFQALENYQIDGIWKWGGFPNRKGLIRVGLYHDGDGCTFKRPSTDQRYSYNVTGERYNLNILSNDCIYTHYPPGSVLLFELLRRAKLLVNFSFEDFSSLMAPIRVLTAVLIFLNLYLLTSERKISFFLTLFVLLSKVMFDFSYEIFSRPFEILFLLLSLFFLQKKMFKTSSLCSFLMVLFGFDFIVPVLLFNGFLLWRKKIPWKLSILTPCFMLFYLFIRIWPVGAQEYRDEFTRTIIDRFGGSDYIAKFFEGLRFFYRGIHESFIPIEVQIVVIVCFFLLTLSQEYRKYLLGMIGLFFLSINMLIFVPETTSAHAWLKYRYLLFFYVPLMALLGVYLEKIRRGGAIFFIGLLLVCSPIYSNLSNFLKTNMAMNTYVENNRLGMEQVTDLFITTSKLPEDKNRWRFFNKRKRLLSPIPPKKDEMTHLWGFFNDGTIAQNVERHFEILVKFKQATHVQHISVLGFKNREGTIECSFVDLESGKLFKKQEIVNKGSELLEIKLDVNGQIKLVKIQCENFEQFDVRRLWFV